MSSFTRERDSSSNVPRRLAVEVRRERGRDDAGSSDDVRSVVAPLRLMNACGRIAAMVPPVYSLSDGRARRVLIVRRRSRPLVLDERERDGEAEPALDNSSSVCCSIRQSVASSSMAW